MQELTKGLLCQSHVCWFPFVSFGWQSYPNYYNFLETT